VGEVNCDMAKRGGYWVDWLTGNWPKFDIPMCWAVHEEEVFEDQSLPSSQEHVTIRKVTMWNMMIPSLWHRIDIEITHVIRNKHDKEVLKTWKNLEYKKAYTYPEVRCVPGEAHWPTYRWMLEEFVNRIRRREGAGTGMSADESILQMSMIDSAYEKSGLPVRPTSSLLEA